MSTINATDDALRFLNEFAQISANGFNEATEAVKLELASHLVRKYANRISVMRDSRENPVGERHIFPDGSMLYQRFDKLGTFQHRPPSPEIKKEYNT